MFSEKLINLRKSKNLTQEDLAKLLFVSRSAVAKWEQNRAIPNAVILKKIAACFSISLSELIKDTEIVIVDDYNGESVFSSLYNRIAMLLKKEEYEKCDEIIETILNKDLHQVQAYLFKIAIEYKLHSIDELYDSNKPINKNKYYILAYEIANKEEKIKLEELSNKIKNNFVNENNEKIYNLALLCEKNNESEKAEKYYRLLDGYKDSNLKIENILYNRKKLIYETAIKYLENKDYVQAKTLFINLNDFEESKNYVKKCEEKTLQYADLLVENGKLNNLKKAKTLYLSLEIDEQINKRISAVNKRIDLEKKKNTRKTILVSIVVLIFSLIGFLTGKTIVSNINDENLYNNSITLINKNKIDEANELINKIENQEKKAFLINLIDVFDELRNDNYEKAMDLIFEYDIDNIAYLHAENYGLDTIEYKLESRDDELPHSEKLGYSFNNWDLTYFLFEENVLKLGYKGFYIENQYSITYQYDKTLDYTGEFITYYGIETKKFELPKLIKKGYEFKGWLIDRFTLITEVNPEDYLKDIVLIPKFEIITYTITYHLNGGVNNSLNNKLTYTIKESDIELYAPTYENYIFKGWATSSDGNNIITKIESNSAQNYDLYAIWLNPQYKITYHLNGGTNHEDNISLFMYERVRFTLKKPTKTEYIFLGWYLDENFTTQCTILTNETMVDIDLYAKWQKEYSYVYYYVGEDGVNNPANINLIRYDDSNVYSLSNPHLSGCIFNGWYENYLRITAVQYVEGKDYYLVAKFGDYSAEYIDKEFFGKGTVSNPYQIHDRFELAGLAYLTDSATGDFGWQNKYYKLMNDIDMEGCVLPAISYSHGGKALDFSGTFDGNNYKIYNFDESNFTGFIDSIDNNAVIKNLTIEFDNIVSNGYSASGIIIKNSRSNHNICVENCDIKGDITINAPKSSQTMNFGIVIGTTWWSGGSYNIKDVNYIGNIVINNQISDDEKIQINVGLVGTSRCPIDFKDCSFTSKVDIGCIDTNIYLGGLVGYSSSSFTAINCSTNISGTLSTKGTIYVGGIIGYSTSIYKMEKVNSKMDILIDNSGFTFDENSTLINHYIGGLVGQCNKTAEIKGANIEFKVKAIYTENSLFALYCYYLSSTSNTITIIDTINIILGDIMFENAGQSTLVKDVINDYSYIEGQDYIVVN